jgi:tetratricopeptide (TPR) repeat protein
VILQKANTLFNRFVKRINDTTIGICFSAVLLLIANTVSGNHSKTDSLWAVYNNKNQPDSNRLKAISMLARGCITSNPDSSISLAKLQFDLGNSSTYKKGKIYAVKALNLIGVAFRLKGNFPGQIEYGLKVLQLGKEIGDQRDVADAYTNIGIAYFCQSDYPKTLDYSLKAMEIREAMKDKKGLGDCYSVIGSVYREMSNNTQALDYHLRSLKLMEELSDQYGIANCCMNIGIVYGIMKEYKKAIEYNLRAIKIDEEIGNKQGLGACYTNIGTYCQDLSEFTTGMQYALKALGLNKEFGDKDGIGICYINLSELCSNMGDSRRAIQYGDSALQIFKEVVSVRNEGLAYGNLATVYSKMKKFKEAYENEVRFKTLTDSVFNVDNSKQLSDLKTKYEVEKREGELKIKAEAEQQKLKAIADIDKRRQQAIIYSVVFVLVLTAFFGLFMFNRFRITKKQKHIIEHQKEIVEEHRKEIIDSITYAKRLQQAILPPIEELKQCFPQSFLIYKPKDIVAGDFYWMEQLDNIIYIAAADCTGHGVPGAMVSIVCSNALNRAVKEFGLRETGLILDKTRDLVLETFAKSNSEVKDGMDISLLAIDRQKGNAFWSGANNQLWYIENSELKEITANKQPIGKSDDPRPFTTHTVEINRATTFYLMTDGFPDQFGGERGKKFKYKPLQEMLVANCEKHMEEQEKILSAAFMEWKGNLEQVDDVTIIGIRI